MDESLLNYNDQLFIQQESFGFNRETSNKFECGGKLRFKTRDEANREIYRIMHESFSNTPIVRSYKCKYCKGWHFTTFK